jgi:hypothetical protein
MEKGGGVKNFLITLGLALAVCALAFGTFYVMSDEPALHEAAREGDAMMWLRAEFRLNDEQFAAIKKMHDDYGVVCGEHCAAIMKAKNRGAPAAEVAGLEKTCVDAMTQHFKAVAALMPAGQGARYLAIVLPRVAGYDHATAPNVRVVP